MAGEVTNAMRARLEPLLENPNVRSALDVIAYSEGTYGKGNDGYDVGFGTVPIDISKGHPRTTRQFTQTDGTKNRSSAAGRYQVLARTYDDVAPRLGISDFSPRSQDLIAVALMERRGALDDVVAGNLEKGISKLGQEWVSLPSANTAVTKQNKRTYKDIKDFIDSNANAVPVEMADGSIMTLTPRSVEEAMDVQTILSQPTAARQSLTNLLAYMQAGTEIAEARRSYTLPQEIQRMLLEIVKGS